MLLDQHHDEIEHVNRLGGRSDRAPLAVFECISSLVRTTKSGSKCRKLLVRSVYSMAKPNCSGSFANCSNTVGGTALESKRINPSHRLDSAC